MGDHEEAGHESRLFDEGIDATEALIDVDPAEGWRLAEKLLDELPASGCPQQRARLHAARGRLLTVLGDFERARSALGLARRTWMLSDRQFRATTAALAHFAIQIELGEYREVVDGSTRLLSGLNQSSTLSNQGSIRHLHAGIHECLARALAGLGDLSRSLQHSARASNLYLALGDPEAAARTYLTRGKVMTRQGMPMLALEMLLRAHEQFTASGAARQRRLCQLRIAEAYIQFDRLPSAIDLLEVTLQETDPSERPLIARLQLAQSCAFLRRGWHTRAQAAAAEAATTFHELGMVDALAQAHLMSGTTALLMGHAAIATSELRSAERLADHCGNVDLLEQIWLRQAEEAAANGRTGQARSLAERIIQSTTTDVHPGINLAQASLFAAKMASTDEAAAADLETAASVAWADGSRHLQLKLLESRGVRNMLRGDVEAAADDFRAILRIVKTMAMANQDVLADSEIVALAHEACTTLVQLLLEVDTHQSRAEAWRWQAGVKYQMVSGALRPPSRATGQHAGCLEDAISALVPDLIHSLISTRSEIRPDWHKDSEPARTMTTGPGLDYYMLEDDLIIFALRDGEVFVRRIVGGSHQVRELSQAWQHECTRLALIPDNAGLVLADDLSTMERAHAILRALHRILIEPVSDLLDDPDVERLLVVGHREIHGLPFAALLDENGRALASRYHLVHSLAAAAGPSEIEATAGSEDGSGALLLAIPDAEAPMVSAEAAVIATLMPETEVHLGADATSDRLLHTQRRYEHIHVACHGEFMAREPSASTLQFADRKVSAVDIMHADLRGARVVLSACASGSSAPTSMEPVGLAWAALVAGANEVVSALWPVQDTVTFQFMEAFYVALAAGADISEALSAAQAEIARSHPHPYFWAAFRHLTSPRRLRAIGL